MSLYHRASLFKHPLSYKAGASGLPSLLDLSVTCVNESISSFTVQSRYISIATNRLLHALDAPRCLFSLHPHLHSWKWEICIPNGCSVIIYPLQGPMPTLKAPSCLLNILPTYLILLLTQTLTGPYLNNRSANFPHL
jgi:hypothetical protein